MSSPAASGFRLSFARLDVRGDGRWLTVMVTLTLVELVWWALCWGAGIAPAPMLGTYLALAATALVAALALRVAFEPRGERASWKVLLVAMILVALAASLFLPLKYAIPGQVAFWMDVPVARVERQLFGIDAWRIADRLFGWALLPMDRVYALWLPVQSVVLFSVILLPPSPRKTRAMTAYWLIWFLLGVVAAVLCASVGPIFYDRLLGGHEFAGLTDPSRSGAWMARDEADAMWASFATRRPGLVAGISAMPSIHVAISFWMWLTARSLAPRVAPFALAYALFMWVASVLLGWHYFSDGLAALLGTFALWWVAKWIAGRHELC